MIGRLRGTLIEKGPERCLVDVMGVGYEVMVSLETLRALGPVGEEANLTIATYVREDQLALFGFFTELERHAFGLLMGVSGIGPKLAITILGLPLVEIVGAIRRAEPKRLTAVSGVGKKLAERIVLELKEK